MNTGLLRHAVATVLTVYGIETLDITAANAEKLGGLQQCLPFTVLKRSRGVLLFLRIRRKRCNSAYRLRY